MIKKFLRWLLCSFERGACGASSKKISLFVFMSLVVFLHIVVGRIFLQEDIKDSHTIIWILLGFSVIDCTTILLIMQIIKAQDIINFKNANGSTDPSTTSGPSSDEKIS